jgi:hypothetical protein
MEKLKREKESEPASQSVTPNFLSSKYKHFLINFINMHIFYTPKKTVFFKSFIYREK